MGVPLSGQEPVDRYRETDGEQGHDWQGTTVLPTTLLGRGATAEEKPELWRTMTATGVPYGEFQAKADRKIPVVVLELG